MTFAPSGAAFFDFAGTLFSDRDLREVHLRQLRFVAAAAYVDPSDDELRAAYRMGMGVAYRAVASQPAYAHRDLFGETLADVLDLVGIGRSR